MSIRSWGAFKLKDTDISWQDLVELAFKAVEIATKYRIGIIIGFNVKQDHYKEFEGMRDRMPFELLDDPHMNVAQTLFGANGLVEYLREERVDTGEDLASRMHKVQSFLEEILCSDFVKGVILHLYGEVGDEYTIEIKAKDFQKTIVELFKKENNYAPTVRFNISK
jgi:hypothetical protein